jgi:DNA (cytosine-5)-methyltransferase 1
VPDPARRGITAERWFRRMRQAGYVVDVRVSSAADYGDPTTRTRMLVIARRDGRPIVWPAATHAPRAKAAAAGLKVHAAAASFIDFSRPCPSIFLTRDEAKAAGCKRPLEAATLRRIARGTQRFTIAKADPFIVPVTHRGDDRVYSAEDPLRTATTAKRGEFAVIQPVFAGQPPVGQAGSESPAAPDGAAGHGSSPFIVRTDMASSAGRAGIADAQDALRTVMTSGGMALVSPVIVPHFGEREGQEPRSRDPAEPYPTVVPGGRGGDLAAVHLIKLSENSLGQPPGEPLHTVMAGAPRHGVVAAHLTKFRTHSDGQDLGEPGPTIAANSFEKRPGGAAPVGLVEAQAVFVEQANTDMVGHDARDPLSTIVGKGCTQRVVAAQLSHFRTSNTAGGQADVGAPLTVNVAGANHHALLTAHLDAYYGSGSVGGEAGEPLRTATALARHSLIVAQLSAVADHGRRPQVLAFLRAHFGEPTAADVADPLGSVEARTRFGIVLLPGEAGPVPAFIVDIGMRMLDPETELARAMGWPADYRLSVDAAGRKVTKTTITKLVGNGVCKAWAEAHLRANCADLPWWNEPERRAA